MPLVQRLFSFENFSLFFFWERFGNLEFFFFFYINIYMNKVHQMRYRFLEFKETWNKLTNFKLNHDVANQMWSEAKLGHLLLLDPFRMLETWHAWTLIMIKWLGLALDLLVFAWNGLGLHLEGMHLVSFWPLMLIMCRHLWWLKCWT